MAVGTSSGFWLPVAAYLYVLTLDGPALAWEYLRRNPDYRRDWNYARRDNEHFAEQWALAFPENPNLDARDVQPVWRTDPDALVRIAADDDHNESDADAFSLWDMPGRKSLLHDGRRLLLSSAFGARVLRMAITSDVCDGGSFAYVIRSGPRAVARWRGIQENLPVLRAAEPTKRYALSPRPGRLAVLHMRALQAIDGRAAGASQRDIAAAIFGEERVAEDWHADSELRAQTRHLIHRGQALMRGEYRSLISRGITRRYGDQRH